MFKKILVGVDGSEDSKGALAKAAELAEKFGSEIIIISVIPREVKLAIIQAEVLDGSIFAETEKMVAELASDLKARGLQARGITVFGDVANEILKTCEEEGCDLIVVGSRGLGKVERFLLGSIASKVIVHAKVPVLVVR
ncbi:MAG: universal stress protein [Methanocellales archaeon]